MTTITDFNEWLKENDLSEHDDIDSLFRTVKELSNYGLFSIKEAKGAGNGWIVYSNGGENTLHIQTEKARESFLKTIEDRYCGGMPEEGWYEYHRAMEKND